MCISPSNPGGMIGVNRNKMSYLTEQLKNSLEWEGSSQTLPAIVQHAGTAEVIMFGYMNKAALDITEESGLVTFYSLKEDRVYTKGNATGHYFHACSITTDAENRALLILAHPLGSECAQLCSSNFDAADTDWAFFGKLESLLAKRKNASPETSYTATLYAEGTKRIAQKVGEEGIETALAAAVNDNEELTREAADLVYHLLVLLQHQNLTFSSVINELRARHR
jgi:phosphoribosyl-ATP pyrophosphohydrolase/phosphoribosyl-AMP cyclohydrolase